MTVQIQSVRAVSTRLIVIDWSIASDENEWVDEEPSHVPSPETHDRITQDFEYAMMYIKNLSSHILWKASSREHQRGTEQPRMGVLHRRRRVLQPKRRVRL